MPGAALVMPFGDMAAANQYRAEHRRLYPGHNRVELYARVTPVDLSICFDDAARETLRNVIRAVYGVEVSHGRPPGSFELTTPHRELLRKAAIDAAETIDVGPIADDEIAWIDWAITDTHLPF